MMIEPIKLLLDRLRKWDFRDYDMSDPQQYEAVAEMLLRPFPRVKK